MSDFGLVRVCPTPCDDDCLASCHEIHKPRGNQDHDPSDCPKEDRWVTDDQPDGPKVPLIALLADYWRGK